MFKRLTISRQILFIVISLIFLAFTVTAVFTYRQASEMLLDNELAAQQSKVESLAALLEGRFDSVKQIAYSQVQSLGSNQFAALSIGGGIDNVQGVAVPRLLQDGQPLLGNSQMMDDFYQLTGSHATLFVYQQGDFFRVLTSLRKENGARAIGTSLGSDHPGYATLIRGEPYINRVELFGQEYLSYYQPVVDDSKALIAMIFVGLPMADVVADITESLSYIVWGKTGYSILSDEAEPNKGTFIYHPSERVMGTNMADVQSADGSKPFASLLDKRQGVIRYMWQTDNVAEEKYLVYSFVDGWEWKILGGSFISEITEASTRLLWNICLIAVISAVIIIIFTTVLLNRILQPLSRLTEQVDAFGKGHVSQSFDHVDEPSNNETHRLSASFSSMGMNLQTLIKDLKGSATELGDTAKSLTATADQCRSDMEDMERQTDQLSSASEQMNVSAASVAEQASTIAMQMQSAKSDGDSCGVQVTQMTHSMAELGGNLTHSSKAIRDVAEQCKNIENVTQIIDEIAGQTNLLALNAAIEAARAGEQGRGFAVVADEVRQLAHRTQQSVKEVVTIINHLQNSTDAAVDLMQKSQTMGDSVNQRAQDTGATLQGIVDQINSISLMSDSIATTAEQQAQVTVQIAEWVTQVRDLSESNLIGAKQTFEGAEKVNRASQSLNDQVAFFH